VVVPGGRTVSTAGRVRGTLGVLSHREVEEAGMDFHPSYRVDAGLLGWAEDLLRMRVYATPATVHRDGSPHTVPVGFAFDGERIVIPSGSGTRKTRNIIRDPRVRVLVEAPSGLLGLEGWAAADGSARLVDGTGAGALNLAAVDRFLTAAGRAAWEHAMAPMMDVAIVVAPDRWHTWTDATMNLPLVAEGYRRRNRFVVAPCRRVLTCRRARTARGGRRRGGSVDPAPCLGHTSVNAGHGAGTNGRRGWVSSSGWHR
jgi:PPOX class probable F420-dependent enzyme